MKQAILVRHDLKLSRGKLAAQAAHASVEAVLRSTKEQIKNWHREGMKKIVLKVPTKDILYKYIQLAKDAGLTTAIITDAGHTHVAPGTVTCAAIGPDDEEKIDRVVGELSLYP
ncbi:peptidyl-tRNA hydrolase [Candidatus Woesearchaeota archaeon]|nr:peptidyl-tRNA hydrolase [Candidatus Woesearchaeota archaeon]